MSVKFVLSQFTVFSITIHIAYDCYISKKTYSEFDENLFQQHFFNVILLIRKKDLLQLKKKNIYIFIYRYPILY